MGLWLFQEGAKKTYDEIMGRISTTTNIADAKDCDLIIEVWSDEYDISNSEHCS